ncbi:MAG: HAD family phosphatase [Chloroflexi bacterium]|jgi:epoxide hydrolase-like predicted phosphatase|nr:HAD family phosphatase [Chloroflexota bacterium]
MTIKAFIFDCGGVLLRNGDLSPYQVWEQRLGLDSGKLENILWNGDTWKKAEVGQLTDDEFWACIGEQLGLEDQEQVQALRQDLWSTWQVDEQVLAMVDRAREHCAVAILSNASDNLEEMLTERYKVADRFHLILNSARLGIAKPDPAIYEEALRQLGIKAGEAVFIDDRAENITAAAALGMHVVWFVHPGELERQLKVYLHNHSRNEDEGRDAASA